MSNNSLWDYNEKELSKTESGRAKILERKLNYGRKGNEKISIAEVKKYWDKMDLFPLTRKFWKMMLEETSAGVPN
ncbi:hypothetical protein GF360_03705 [candidate division WWE3 bacterium]|nr:hypothetical protein [candidate division WWE3 bacterium]